MKLLVVVEDRGEWKAGDIVACVPDDHRWGARESLDRWVEAGNDPAEFPNPQFGIVEIPDQAPDLNLTEPQLSRDPETGETVAVDRRAWRVDIDGLDISGGRVVTMERRAGLQRTTNKQTGGRLPGRRANQRNLAERRPAATAPQVIEPEPDPGPSDQDQKRQRRQEVDGGDSRPNHPTRRRR